jgi:hypothetical protein
LLVSELTGFVAKKRWKPLVEKTKSATGLWVASRAYGMESQNNPAQQGELEGKKTSGHK